MISRQREGNETHAETRTSTCTGHGFGSGRRPCLPGRQVESHLLSSAAPSLTIPSYNSQAVSLYVYPTQLCSSSKEDLLAERRMLSRVTKLPFNCLPGAAFLEWKALSIRTPISIASTSIAESR